MTRWMLAALLFAAPLAALAQPAGPFAPPNGFALLSSHQLSTATFQPVITAESTAGANAQVGQWGAPGDFPPFTCGARGTATVCTSADPWSSFQTVEQNGEFSEIVSQNGAAAPCTSARGWPSELDLFISPKGLSPGYASKRDFPSLQQLAQFTSSGVFTVDEAGPSPGPQACKANHAGATLGLMLIDDKVQPRQMFWYSVQLFAVCIPGTEDYDRCVANHAHPQTAWVWTGTQGPRARVERNKAGDAKLVNFDVVEPLSAYGQGPVRPGQPTTLSLNFLAHLSGFISSGQYGVDPNLADWRLAGVTLGQALWGGTKMTTTWQGFWPSWQAAK